ncbi:chromosome partitioning protein [Breznakiella homolactica]|uniref:Chromosome partitioning protein n=2 Tax=Breznakiella homolactica TaxID=2798577 RepID=A0A7T7XRQ1_9SPIR|nr:chromosome partitioning protein [Breznakiella homolactica]
MDTKAAKEYILHHITALKLNEKNIRELDSDINKWENRIQLAHSKGISDLAEEAEKEVLRIKNELDTLKTETADLKSGIQRMIRQLPGLAARDRSVDPDLLEQELLIVAGFMPGDEEKAAQDREFAALEKNAQADSALADLKKKLQDGNQ